MNMARIPVSVVVPVKNEELNLPYCLSRLKRFSEVVVIDSGSIDRTCAIAHQYGARVVQFDWNGTYPKKRNWALLNESFCYDWILFLDADEIVSNSFCDEIANRIQSDRHNGYWIRYTSYFCGRKLHYGDAQRKLALFRLGTALYERINEESWSQLDMEIHEHPLVNGSVGHIRSMIDHQDRQGVVKSLERHLDYAKWEKKRTLVLRRGDRDRWSQLTQRQRFKYRYIDRWWFAWLYFFISYVAKLGILDGAAGFNHAFYKLWYFKTIGVLLREESELAASENS